MLFAKDIDAIACGVGAALLLADEAEHGGRTRPTSSARLPQSLAIAFILCRLHISRSHRRPKARERRGPRVRVLLAHSTCLRSGLELAGCLCNWKRAAAMESAPMADGGAVGIGPAGKTGSVAAAAGDL